MNEPTGPAGPTPTAFAEMLADALEILTVPVDVTVPMTPGTNPDALAAFYMGGAITAAAMMIYNNVLEQCQRETNELSAATWARGFQRTVQVMTRPEDIHELETRISTLYARLVYQAGGYCGMVATTPRSAASSMLLNAAHGSMTADALETLTVDQMAEHHSIGGATVADSHERAVTGARDALEALERRG